MTKDIFRNIPKTLAYLQTMTKTPATFPEDPSTTVGGDVATRYLLSELEWVGDYIPSFFFEKADDNKK